MQLDCPLCEEPQTHETIGTRDRRGGALHSVLCLACGLGRTHPMPSLQELSDFYATQYRRDYKSVEEPSPYHVLRAGRLAQMRLSMLRDVLSPNAKTLDCGSGGGEFVYLARRIGCQSKGIEPNLGFANYARRELGLDIESAMLEDLKIEDLEIRHQRYHLITLFHVLEHIRVPAEYLRRASLLLDSPEAVLAVEVPNLTATGSHPVSRFHRAHLYHFTESTLRAIGAKAGLYAFRSGHTEDGTNVWAHFRLKPAADRHPGKSVSARQVLETLRRQRASSYYLSPFTWKRTASRLVRQTSERIEARGHASRRAILDGLPLPF